MPGHRAVAVQAAALAAAMLGGLHVIDLGAAWRLTCGLWTGYVVMVWLVGAAVRLRQVARLQGRVAASCTGGFVGTSVTVAAFLGFAASFARLHPPGREIWVWLVILGAVFLATASATAVVSGAAWARALVRRRRP